MSESLRTPRGHRFGPIRAAARAPSPSSAGFCSCAPALLRVGAPSPSTSIARRHVGPQSSRQRVATAAPTCRVDVARDGSRCDALEAAREAAPIPEARGAQSGSTSVTRRGVLVWLGVVAFIVAARVADGVQEGALEELRPWEQIGAGAEQDAGLCGMGCFGRRKKKDQAAKAAAPAPVKEKKWKRWFKRKNARAATVTTENAQGRKAASSTSRQGNQGTSVLFVKENVLCTSVADGDTVTVRYVPKGDELPKEAWDMVNELAQAASVFDNKKKEQLQKKLLTVHDVKWNEHPMGVYKEMRIRLRAVDTPEGKQAFGEQARAFTAQRCLNKAVTVRVYDVDRYNRYVADVVTSEGKLLNEELLAAGWAWHYKAYDDRANMAQLEQEARRAGRGLWVDENPTPPWDFRAANRNGNGNGKAKGKGEAKS